MIHGAPLPYYEDSAAPSDYRWPDGTPVPFIGPRFHVIYAGSHNHAEGVEHTAEVYDRQYIDTEGYPMSTTAYGYTMDEAMSIAFDLVDMIASNPRPWKARA